VNYEKATKELQEYFTENQEPEEIVKLSISELQKFNPELSDYFRQRPEEAIEAAKEVIQERRETKKETKVKITDIPTEEQLEIKNLSAKHIEKLVAVKGLITEINDARVELTSAVYECTQCGDHYEKDHRGKNGFESPYKCECGSKMFEVVEKEYLDVQNLSISYNSEKLECILEADTIDSNEYIDQKVIVYGIPQAEDGIITLRAKSVQKTSTDDELEQTDLITEITGDKSVNSKESALNSLNHIEFKELIANIFKAEGWETELVSAKGVDIIARKRLPVPQKFVIQVKHYEESKVTPDDVQQYNSLKEQEPNTDQAVLITSSTYTDKAKELADSLEIKTLDRDYVIRMINQIEQ
jgi:DNA replicative helicase MCM subunit Mcm2 (Cdc46/Mcm family)